MTTAPTDSILTADIGSVNTRTALLDIVSGEFRFVAAGAARTTVEAPFNYMGEGLRHSLDHLREITGRPFIDESDQLIMPARADGSGVDAFAATASAGAPVRVALVGLMPSVSLATARRVAAASYCTVVETLGLGDRRREDQQVDALLAARPEVVIIAGGTEGGSQAAVLRLAETVALAAHLMPQNARPEILYAGNSALREKIQDSFAALCEVTIADNLRPELDDENCAPARRQLALLYERVRLARITGYADVAQPAGGKIIPTAAAFGTVIRYLNLATNNGKGALGVDIGSSSTTIAAAFGGELSLTVKTDTGVGHNAAETLKGMTIDRFIRWLPEAYSEAEVCDYLYNKSMNPATVPQDMRELYLEHALARQCAQAALAAAQVNWPPNAKGPGGDLMPWFDPIVGTGSVLARAPKLGQAALIMLDALQPTGVSTLILDANSIGPAVGAAGALNPLAAVQILRSTGFVTLGTAISLAGRARYGQRAARIKVSPLAGGEPLEAGVAFGSIAVLRLPAGREAKVTIQPAGGFDAGFGRGVSKTVTVSGGEVGVIVDARGRPLVFPNTPAKRYEALSKWNLIVGQYGV